MPFSILQYTQCIPNELTNALLCVPLIFTDSKNLLFWWWLPSTTEIICIFNSSYKKLFEQLLLLYNMLKTNTLFWMITGVRGAI